MYVRTYASIVTASLLGLACLTSPARAAETDAVPVSATLKQQLLTDEKIADLCRASIKHKYDMVETSDDAGTVKKVPRCVANYEAIRATADSYLKQEESAKAEIVAAVADACGDNPNQASCLEAGRSLASKAADLHEALSHNAESAIERLASGPSVK